VGHGGWHIGTPPVKQLKMLCSKVSVSKTLWDIGYKFSSEPNSTTRTPATNTGYRHHQRTKICHIPTSWHVEMLGSGIAMWQICCRIVASSSVGGVVQHFRSRCSCSGVWLLGLGGTVHCPAELHRLNALRCVKAVHTSVQTFISVFFCFAVHANARRVWTGWSTDC